MSAGLEHPTYPNPTVVEALCHIDFQTPPNSEWQINRPTKFLQSISEEYPVVEPVPGPAVVLSIGASSAGPPSVSIPAALRLSSDSRDRYIGVGNRHFAFGYRGKYPGWENFREALLRGWRSFIEIARPSEVTKIGLRYVNLIPRTSDHPLISDWLKPTSVIPERLIESKQDPFLLRLESWIEPMSLLIVTVGIVAAPSGPPQILFDIERTSNKKSEATPELLVANVDALHNDVWRVFSLAKTERLDAHLRAVVQ